MKKNGVGMWAGLGLWVAAVGMVCAAEPGKSTGASKPTLTVTVIPPHHALHDVVEIPQVDTIKHLYAPPNRGGGAE